MLLQRRASRALAPWVSRVWVAREQPATLAAPGRERLVPTGGFHLVLRLDETRIRIFDDLHDQRGRAFTAVIGGARSRFHVRQASAGARSIGMQIRPGGAGVILGVPGQALAQRHTALEDVWGRGARELRERLMEAGPAEQQLAIFEETVAARLELRFAPHPAVREALGRFGSEATRWAVTPVRRDSRLSHRRFVELFRRQVGLGPKQLCRVLRLGRALHEAQHGAASWAQVGQSTGYCDQSHLVREMRAIAGVSPTQWTALARARGHGRHIPVVNFVQDGTGALA